MRGICCSVGICTPAVAPSATASASADIGRFFWRDISFCLPFDLPGQQLTVSIIPKQPATVNCLLGIWLSYSRTTKKKMSTAAAINKQQAEDEPALCDFVTFNPSPSTSTSTKGTKGQMSHLAYGKVVGVAVVVVAAALADCGCFAIVIFLISRLMQSAASDCVRLRDGVAFRQSVRLLFWRLLSQNIINVQFIFGLRLCHPHGKEMLLCLTRSAVDLRGKGQQQQKLNN